MLQKNNTLPYISYLKFLIPIRNAEVMAILRKFQFLVTSLPSLTEGEAARRFESHLGFHVHFKNSNFVDDHIQEKSLRCKELEQ